MKRKTSILFFLISLLSACFFTSSAFAYAGSEIGYQVKDAGGQFQDMVGNGVEAGGTGKISAMNVDLGDTLKARGSIQYRTLNENKGWFDWVNEGQPIGDDSNGIQAVRMKLTGQLPYYYDLYYRVHVPNVGWSGWGKNGTPAGSEGLSRNISILQIIVTNKGVLPPGGTFENRFSQAKWTWPVPGHYTITSGVGPRWGLYHDGLDITGNSGDSIVAAKAGVVRLAGPNGLFGNCVVIQNDSGETCYYAHMVRVGCNVGDHVNAGQVIGFVGTTGNSNHEHLHFEVYDADSSLMNPLPYLR